MDHETEDSCVIADIRKLRKKLRQIENLERLDRPLNDEENHKVAKKNAIRSLIHEKLSELPDDILSTPETSTNAPESFEDYTDSGPANRQTEDYSNTQYSDDEPEEEQQESAHENMKRSHKHLDDSTSRQGGSRDERRSEEDMGSKRLKEEKGSSASGSGRGDAQILPRSGIHTASASTSKKAAPQKSRGKSDLDKEREKWRKVKFSVQDLEGHHDLISCVDCKDNTILSGSRDTTVKAWDRQSGAEVCSLGGHSGSVTAVHLLTSQDNRALAGHYELNETCRYALSASTDCSVRLWDLDSVKELRSIYTFNAVTAMAFLSTELFAVTGSDGGKVELWDVTLGENSFSLLAHEGGVTCIKVKGKNVVTASSDGVIKLWEVQERSLHLMFESENIRNESGSLVQRPIVSLGLANNLIYYGDDGINVKVLDWRKGSVEKLKNHLGDFGSTDSMWLGNDVLLFSSYDIDNGVGSINFFNASGRQYLSTLCDHDTSRIECVSSPDPSDAAKFFVTAGHELRAWRIVPNNHQSSGDLIAVTFDHGYTMPVEDSEDDSSESEMEGDDIYTGSAARVVHRRSHRRTSTSSDAQQGSWLSWCSIV